MYKMLMSLVFVLALAAANLAAPVLQVHSEEPQPWSKTLDHQLSLPEVQNSGYVVVIFLGVGDRFEEANEIRQYYADAYRQKYGDDVTVLALPTYAGEGRGGLSRSTTDVLIRSAARHLYEGYPGHVAEALGEILEKDYTIAGIACHSGAGYVCNNERSDIISVLQQHADQVVSKLKIAFVNTDLPGLSRKDYERAGFSAESIQWDGVTWVTTAGRRFVPFGEYLGPVATLVGNMFGKSATIGSAIAAALTKDHSLKNQEKVKLLEESFGLPERFPQARERSGSGPDLTGPIADVSGPERQTAPGGVATPSTPFWSDPPPAPPFWLQPALVPPPWPVPPAPQPLAPKLAETGGVDFSTVELRYLTDYAEPSAHVFGAALRGGYAEPGQGIDLERATELSWTSFFVWLLLPDSTFWVNLNPDEPDRIIDDQLGKTDVGRILLEADLQMKKDMARLTHPDSPLGKAFWDKLSVLNDPGEGNQQETSISLSWRVWIVPGEVTVFADDSQIYVADARLDVMLEAEYLEALSGGGESGSPDEPVDNSEALAYAEGVLKEMILPELVKEVNKAPKYRELRQVFYSRVVAEWYKSNDHVDELAFGGLVDRREIHPLESQEPWAREDIFERYTQSLEEGEYSITRETKEDHGTYTLTITQTFFSGGVDLTGVPTVRMSHHELVAREPNVNDQLLDALVGPGYRSDTEEWIGELFVLDTSHLEDLPIRGREDVGMLSDPEGDDQTANAPGVGEVSPSKSGRRVGARLLVVVGSLMGVAVLLAAGLWWLRGRDIDPYY